MDVRLHLRSLVPVGFVGATRPARREAAIRATQEEVAFENTRALTTALSSSPGVRDEVIRRATELVGNVDYPPADTIRQISRLLASQLEGESERA